MDAQTWRRVKYLVAEAGERPPTERQQFLADRCDDPALRAEILAMLETELRLTEVVADAARTSVIGSGARVGGYVLGEVLGRGGMGVVYRARDTRLLRDVAIKVLSTALTALPDRLARLRQEAQLLASLNHPNICAIYDLLDVDGVCSLVLELIDGETLAEHLITNGVPKPLSPPQVLAYARQIVDALDAAHERGIVHRDLKPGNIKITAAGTVKVLDFGLGKAAGASTGSAALITEEGTILGTAAYMSPEQARGEATDKRTDIWAFGCVLFEMLTGKRAFDGRTTSDALAAVLSREPDWSRLPAETPAGMRRLLHRCLEKDRQRRLRDIGDVRLELEPESEDDANLAAPRRYLGWGSFAAAAIVIAAIGAALVARAAGRSAEARQLTNLSLVIDGLVPKGLTGGNFALSPDGSSIAFVANPDPSHQEIFIRQLDRSRVKPLPNTAGGYAPAFSPDGRWIAFGQEGELKKMPVEGGAATPLARVRRAGQFDWSVADRIVFTQLTDKGIAIFMVPATGGVPQPIAAPHDRVADYETPQLLPDGHQLLATMVERSVTGIRSSVVTLPLPDGTPHLVVDDAGAARFADGMLSYVRGRTLLTVAFDPASGQTSGDPRSILDVSASATSRTWAASGGTLVYAPPLERRDVLEWVRRSGTTEPLGAEPGPYDTPRLSPDGSRVAVALGNDDTSDVWVYDITRRTRFQLTHDGTSSDPVWTPDGGSLLYASRRSAASLIYRQRFDGVGGPQVIVAGDGAIDQVPTSFSADGRLLAFWRAATDRSQSGAWLLDTTTHEVRPATPGTFSYDGQLSPDGRWVAYLAAQGNEFAAFITSSTPGGPRYPISRGSASELVWARNGHEVFYRSQNQMIAVTLRPGSRLETEAPVVLFSSDHAASPLDSPGYVHYDASADGERFVMIHESSPTPPHLNVLTGFSTLRDLIPR
jgi:serine/threonine protein kinase